jgi:hypothetical protein
MQRKCGVCQLVGHSVRGCSDVGAGVVLADLMSESNLERAKALCRSMPARYVSFALCHGFSVAVSGGRPKLLELIMSRLAPHPVTPVPVPVPVIPPVAPSLVPGVRMLMELLGTEIQKNAEIKLALGEFSHEHLRTHMTFLPTHPNRIGMCEMCEYDLVMVRQNEIKRASTKVITLILMNIEAARSADPHLHIDRYVTSLIQDVSLIRTYINLAATQLHIKLSLHAKKYVMTLINFQNSERRIKYYNRQIHDLTAAATRVPDVMKTLKTVVTCRDISINQEEPVTCGICFDELHPTHVVKTGCDHDFCADCMTGWAKQRGIKSFIQCPCCRAEIDEMTVGDKSEQVKLEQGLAPV